jgi:hypothetical protein
MRTPPAEFTLFGDGLCIAYDSGDAVSHGYKLQYLEQLALAAVAGD